MTKVLHGWVRALTVYFSIQLFISFYSYFRFTLKVNNVKVIFKLETFQNYWEPLKKTENSLIEQNLVGEIFYQVNSSYQRRALVVFNIGAAFSDSFFVESSHKFPTETQNEARGMREPSYDRGFILRNGKSHYEICYFKDIAVIFICFTWNRYS